jgi:putative transposase
LNPRRIAKSAIIIKPSTLLKYHSALKKRKYRQLYSPRGGRKPGPKGPSREVIDAIVEMKRRNHRFGCPRIAQQINLAFGLELDKDVVRRILATHYKPSPDSNGPPWLTTIGHAKDSLWSIDLFRCESNLLKGHWVMVVMDQYTRRIIGFAIHAGMLMAQHSVGCSTMPRPVRVVRNISAQITILCFNISGGKPICAC